MGYVLLNGATGGDLNVISGSCTAKNASIPHYRGASRNGSTEIPFETLVENAVELKSLLKPLEDNAPHLIGHEVPVFASCSVLHYKC